MHTNPLIDQLESLKIKNFVSEKKILEDLLEHYKKLKNRYTQVDSQLKVGSLLIGGILGVGTAVMTGVSTFGIGLMIYIPVVTSILGAVNLFIGETISIGFTSKRKKNVSRNC